MAGFQLTLYGRIWVTPKANTLDFSLTRENPEKPDTLLPD